MNIFFSFLILHIIEILYIVNVSLFLSLLFSKFSTKNLLKNFVICFISVYFHELFHKLMAFQFGYISLIQSPLTIDYMILSLLLYLASGIVIPPPIFTAILGRPTDFGLRIINPLPYTDPYSTLCISLAGPVCNLIIAITSCYLLKYSNLKVDKDVLKNLLVFNIFLFIINMLPIIPGSDGYLVMSSLNYLFK